MTSYNIWRGDNLRTVIGIIALGILLLEGGADAATWTMDDSAGANYTKIQDAIDNASVGDSKSLL